MGDKSGTFSFNPDAGLWEATAVNDSKGPAPPLSGPSLLCLRPRVLVLPQGVTRFTATLQGCPPRRDAVADRSLKLEAVLGGAALPIRMMPAARFLATPSTNFDLASIITFRASEEEPASGSGGEGPEAVWTLDLEVDLDGAIPGLMQLNLWSSAPPPAVGVLLASEKVLLLRSGLDQLSVDLVDEGCGEDLLSDLADVLEVPVKASLGAAHLMVLTDTAEGLLEWSTEAGLVFLEQLVQEQLLLIAERLSAVQAAAAAAAEQSAAPVAAGSWQEPSEAAECGAASQQAKGIHTAASSYSSAAPSPGGAWPLIMLIGIVPSINRSFTDGRGERERSNLWPG